MAETVIKFVASNAARARESANQKSKQLALLYRGDIVTADDTLVGEDGLYWTHTDKGWIYAPSLNTYIEESAYQTIIPDELLIKSSARQYVLWEGMARYNLCGLFSLNHIGMKKQIDDVLRQYKQLAPQEYLTNVTNNRPVGISVLRKLATVWKLEQQEFIAPLTDSVLGFFYSPERLNGILSKGWKPICGVKIGHDGKLNTGDTAHWVVLDSVSPLRDGDGVVSIYNPFPDRYQVYSYGEFIKSMNSFGGMTGLWIK